jgi:hypothetical protein
VWSIRVGWNWLVTASYDCTIHYLTYAETETDWSTQGQDKVRSMGKVRIRKRCVLRLNRYRVRSPTCPTTSRLGDREYSQLRKKGYSLPPIGEVNIVGKPNYRAGGDISMLCAAQ